MTTVFVPRLAPGAVANIRYSRNGDKYGPPPARVTIGGAVCVQFESAADLLTTGLRCPPAALRLLVSCVPGFKRIRPLGQK